MLAIELSLRQGVERTALLMDSHNREPLEHAANLNLVPRLATTGRVTSSVQRFRNRSQTATFAL